MIKLKILRISTDQSIFIDESPSSLRLLKQSEYLEELHVLVAGSPGTSKQLGKNVWVYGVTYPNAFNNEAIKSGKKVVSERAFVRGESVVVAEDPFVCGQIGLAIKNAWRLPLEVECNSNLSHIGFWEDRKVQRVFSHAEGISTVSSDIATYLHDKYKVDQKLIRVVDPYIDTEKVERSKVDFDLHARYHWSLILLTASVHGPDGKNFDMAIDILSQLKRYFPEAGLVILGADNDAGRLEDLANKLGVATHVAFAPHGDDWISYYRTADVFIQTSDFEAYSEEIATAGLVGMPIITTKVGIARQFKNGHDALVCPVGDTECMFRSVYDLLKDDSLRATLKVNVKNAVKSIADSGEKSVVLMVDGWNRIAKMVSTSHD